MKLQCIFRDSTVVDYEMVKKIEVKFWFEKSLFIKSRWAKYGQITSGPVFGAGGKPSTWFPPEGLVEQSHHA